MAACKEESEAPGGSPSGLLARELTCPICLQLFADPASLPCGHVFCLTCLRTLGEGLDQHSCPECQAEYPGTAALQKNLKMHSIIETYKAAALSSRSSRSSAAETPHRSEAETAASSRQGAPGQPQACRTKQEMDECKSELKAQLTELSGRLDVAEGVLKRAKQQESAASLAGGQLRDKTSSLLKRMEDLARSYSELVKQIVEDELGPGEAAVGARVNQASELVRELRLAVLRVESLLTEEDEVAFSGELQDLRPSIAATLAKPIKEHDSAADARVFPARACPKLESANAELRGQLGELQRSLRNVLNPSEVTFDPETAHPNLLLSEDLKTVTFSAAKQPYPSCPQRFTSFFQVLSAQSFSEGEHSWEVEFEGAPWIIGVCHGAKLARSGLPSALESSQSAWCLMWFDNRLTAFDRGQSVPLIKTTMSRRLEIKLSFNSQSLSFSNVSSTSGKTHIHTFKGPLTEAVQLAYRMMSGHPKGRVTVQS